MSTALARGRSAIDGVGEENWESEHSRLALALSDSALLHTLSLHEVPFLLTCWDKPSLMRPDNRCGHGKLLTACRPVFLSLSALKKYR